jgi:hypothetical protein
MRVQGHRYPRRIDLTQPALGHLWLAKMHRLASAQQGAGQNSRNTSRNVVPA